MVYQWLITTKKCKNKKLITKTDLKMPQGQSPHWSLVEFFLISSLKRKRLDSDSGDSILLFRDEECGKCCKNRRERVKKQKTKSIETLEIHKFWRTKSSTQESAQLPVLYDFDAGDRPQLAQILWISGSLGLRRQGPELVQLLSRFSSWNVEVKTMDFNIRYRDTK